MPELSIVMPSLLEREDRSTMYDQIQEQIDDLGTVVEFFCLMDNGPMSTGAKVAQLFGLCSGRYICRVDDDDVIEDDYIETLLKAIDQHDVDLITFDHTYNIDGQLVALTHQIPGCEQKKHPKVKGAPHAVHDRLPGPLCPVRAEIAREFSSPDISEKEDYAYKDFLNGRVETHYNINRVLYHHMWRSSNFQSRAALQWLWSRR